MLPKATTFIFQFKDPEPVADMAVTHDWLIKMKKKCVLKNSYQNNDSYSHYCVHIRTEQYTVPLNIQSKVSVNFGSWCKKIKIKYTLFKNKVFKHGHLSINSILSKQSFWNQISKNWQNMIINVLFCIPQKLVVVNVDLIIACSEHQYIYFFNFIVYPLSWVDLNIWSQYSKLIQKLLFPIYPVLAHQGGHDPQF